MNICLRSVARLSILGLVLGICSFGAQTASQGTSTTSGTAKVRRNRKSTDSTATGTPTSAPPASAPAAAPGGKSATGVKANSEPVNSTSDAEIAAAKASGRVWVNTSSGTYHKSGRYYGKTKQGKFMSEEDAKKAGYKPAKSEIGTKKG
jgi:hypothetical protein